MAERVMEDESRALETLAREELAIVPQELGGSAWEAATASFLLFAFGAIVPVLPFIFLAGTLGVYISLAVSAAGLFVIGAGTTLFTARPVFWSGARQVLFGLAAAGITFGIGRLIGVSLAG
jgi:VIT1/CCC1 family predicted Fe2+/Mn2+ transporter